LRGALGLREVAMLARFPASRKNSLHHQDKADDANDEKESKGDDCCLFAKQ
jgi:hypothetical protein